MCRWYRKNYKWKVTYRGFVFEYDTAEELGKMVAESGCGMPNPYEPDNTDYDDFLEGFRKQRRKMCRPK